MCSNLLNRTTVDGEEQRDSAQRLQILQQFQWKTMEKNQKHYAG